MGKFLIDDSTITKYVHKLEKLLDTKYSKHEHKISEKTSFLITLSDDYCPPHYCFTVKETKESMESCRKVKTRIKKLKELVKNDFRINVGNNVKIGFKFRVEIVREPRGFYDDWDGGSISIRFFSSSVQLFNKISAQEVSIPALISFYCYENGGWLPPKEFLPSSGDIVKIENLEEAKESCVKIIGSLQKFLSQRERDFRERIEFLKQPVNGYRDLFRKSSHVIRNATKSNVTREKMFSRFLMDINNNLLKLGKRLCDEYIETFPGTYFFYHWKLPGEKDNRCEEKIVEALEAVRNLKYLFSCVDPSIVKFVMNWGKLLGGMCSAVNSFIRGFVMSVHYCVEGEEEFYEFPFITDDFITDKEDYKTRDGAVLVEFFSRFEGFLDQYLKKVQLERQVKNFQVKNKMTIF